MQTEDKRACATCGAANRVDATSCWQCLGRLDAGLPQAPSGFSPGEQRVRPGFPPPAPPPVAARAVGRSTSGPFTVVGVLVTLTLVAGGFFFVQRMAGRDVQLPETLAGFPQRHDQMAQEANQEIDRSLAGFNVTYDAGVYGSEPVPEFLIVVVKGHSTDTTDEMFDQFVAGLTEAGSEVVSEGTSADLDGVPHRCVGLRVQGTDMGACSWFADDAGGFLLELQGNHRSTEALLVTIWPELPG